MFRVSWKRNQWYSLQNSDIGDDYLGLSTLQSYTEIPWLVICLHGIDTVSNLNPYPLLKLKEVAPQRNVFRPWSNSNEFANRK